MHELVVHGWLDQDYIDRHTLGWDALRARADDHVTVSAPADPVTPEPKEPMKRLTFDIGASLHKRIRLACLEKDVDMAVELRRILMEHFPPAAK